MCVVVAAAGFVAAAVVAVTVLWRQVISVLALDFSHVHTRKATETTSAAVISCTTVAQWRKLYLL